MTSNSNNTQLIKKYQEMADFTLPKCQTCQTQRGPLTCCNKIACEITLSIARDVWSIDLRKDFDKDATVPFMGSNGCKVAPHLRPHCTLYTCALQVFGTEFDKDWNIEYKKLRNKIDKLEWERFAKDYPLDKSSAFAV